VKGKEVFNIGSRCGWVVNTTSWPLNPRERDPLSSGQSVGWVQGTFWTAAENLALTEIRSPDLPARSDSLYRLSYPGVLKTCSKQYYVPLKPSVHKYKTHSEHFGSTTVMCVASNDGNMVHLTIQSRSCTRTDLKLLGRAVHAHDCWVSKGVCAQCGLQFYSKEFSLEVLSFPLRLPLNSYSTFEIYTQVS